MNWYWNMSERQMVLLLATLGLVSQAIVWTLWATGVFAAPAGAVFFIGLFPWIVANLVLSAYNISQIGRR